MPRETASVTVRPLRTRLSLLVIAAATSWTAANDAHAQWRGRFRPNPYRPGPVFRNPPAYRSYGPLTYRPPYTYPPAYGFYRPYYDDLYRPWYTYPPAYWTYRPWYTYPPAYWTYRPWYTYAPGYFFYYQPGFTYRGTSLPADAMPGFQKAWP